MQRIPLDRVSARDLSYVEFLDRFWRPGRPFILSDAYEMPAWGQWSLDHLLAVAAFDQPAVFKVTRGEASTSEPTTVGAALSQLRDRRRAGTDDGVRYYLTNWEFGLANPALLESIFVPPYFDGDLAPLVREGLFKWIYIGEAGTATATHTDTANTSAWLLLFEGAKSWRMVPAFDHARVRDRDGRFRELFDLDPADPALADLQVFEGVQHPGDIVWNPACLVHAVRNLEFTLSVTYNYIDLTNLPQVYDAVEADLTLLEGIPVPSRELVRLLAAAGRARLEAKADPVARDILLSFIRDEFDWRALPCDW